ncbi:hypothetical protein GCM10025772_24290 [Ferrimonas gelatinilytica]|uniref:Uncharacterized protein n=1 Tax=Ferrimonas gelatinilytica TaxID=1255257 RepID=A0ABP9SAD9_9GAMM
MVRLLRILETKKRARGHLKVPVGQTALTGGGYRRRNWKTVVFMMGGSKRPCSIEIKSNEIEILFNPYE